MKKVKLENAIKENKIDDSIIKRIFNLCITRNIITVIIALTILILSICLNNKIMIFSKLFSSLVNLNPVLITSIYYILIGIIIAYCLLFIFLSLYNKNKNDKWYLDSYKYNNLFDIPVFIVKTFSLLSFVFIFVFTPCNVSGSSMEKTLDDKDKIILMDLFYEPKKNDIIVFDASNYRNESFFIKRVKATQGDKLNYNLITRCLYVNDELCLEDLSYTEYQNIIKRIDNTNLLSFEVVIPDDMLLVIGDNYYNSYDSRQFGLIDKKDVYGKAILRLFPFDKIGIIS